MTAIHRATLGWGIVMALLGVLSLASSGCLPVGGCGAPDIDSSWAPTPTPQSEPPASMALAPLASSCNALSVADFEAACGSMVRTMYVSPTGGSNGFGTASDPTDLASAMSSCNAGGACRIRVASGEIALPSIATLRGCIVLEGGYDEATWTQTTRATHLTGELVVEGRAWIQNVDFDSDANAITAAGTTRQLVLRDVSVRAGVRALAIHSQIDDAATRLCNVDAYGEESALYIGPNASGVRLEDGSWQSAGLGVLVSGGASGIYLTGATLFGATAGVRVESGAQVVLERNDITSNATPVESAPDSNVSSIDNTQNVTGEPQS